MKGRRGSITIFSVLSLLLVTATIFALLEGCRLIEGRRFADLQTEAAVEAAFANYNTCLWKEYRLLGTDISQVEAVMRTVVEGRNGQGINMLRMGLNQIKIEGMKRLTDGQGIVFVECVSSYMKKNILYESLKELYSQYEAIKTLMDTGGMDKENIEAAIEGLKSVEEESNQDSIGTSESNIDISELLEKVKGWQEKGILELVIEGGQSISEAEVDFSQGLLRRPLAQGNIQVSDSVAWTDRVLLQQYLLTYFSNYVDAKQNRALSYELEYLLGKKSSDIENLKIVVVKLLALREATNFLYLSSNPEKVAQADVLATACAGASLNPMLIQVIKIGLLTAWAFVESVMDVRALLAGKRIPLLKSDESWTTTIETLLAQMDGFAMSKESVYGLSYQGYLGILLLFEPEKPLAMYAMNLQEKTIRDNYADTSFRLDALVTEVETSVEYQYGLIFPFLRIVKAEDKWQKSILGKANYTYY